MDSERPAHTWRCAIDDQEVSVKGPPCLHTLKAVEDARQRSRNINLYRTLELFDARQQQHAVGPFVIDVDNETHEAPYQQDLEAALTLTKAVVNLLVLERGLSTGDVCVYFSGCKGFNIEVRPQAIGLTGSLREQVKLSYQLLQDLTEELVEHGDLRPEWHRITTIDRIYWESGDLKHPYLRLHDSVNAWVSSEGRPMARAKLEVVLADLQRTTAEELRSESERLAGISSGFARQR